MCINADKVRAHGITEKPFPRPRLQTHPVSSSFLQDQNLTNEEVTAPSSSSSHHFFSPQVQPSSLPYCWCLPLYSLLLQLSPAWLRSQHKTERNRLCACRVMGGGGVRIWGSKGGWGGGVHGLRWGMGQGGRVEQSCRNEGKGGEWRRDGGEKRHKHYDREGKEWMKRWGLLRVKRDDWRECFCHYPGSTYHMSLYLDRSLHFFKGFFGFSHLSPLKRFEP